MTQIRQDISLTPYNTFAVDVQANFFVEVKHEQEIFDLISMDVFTQYPHLILGGGANILFTKTYEGLVIKVSILGKEVIKEEGNDIYIKVGAGENRHDFVMRTLEQWYVGMENLVLIPGQVGAAPVGNIGAYGKETKDVVYQVEGIDLESKEKKTWSNEDCAFGYRDSIFKHELKDNVIITAVTFVVQKQSPDYVPNIQYNDIQNALGAKAIDPLEITAQQVADIIIEIRENKLPDWKKIGTAGSFFKNPVVTKEQYEKLLINYPQLKWNEVHGSESMPNGRQVWILHSPHSRTSAFKLSAGQLIELAGFKGQSVWAVGSYNNHALIIVNNGGASGKEIRAFAQAIQKKVQALFDVELEPEVIIL